MICVSDPRSPGSPYALAKVAEWSSASTQVEHVLKEVVLAAEEAYDSLLQSGVCRQCCTTIEEADRVSSPEELPQRGPAGRLRSRASWPG
jgi:hypothetical protein